MENESVFFAKAKEILNLYTVPLILTGCGILLLIFGLFSLFYQSKPSVRFISDTASDSGSPVGSIMIDVAGAVQSPGVYSLSAGARVAEGIVKAGGVTIDADIEWINKNLNQAQKITDGTKLYIPFKGEKANTSGVLGISSGGIVTSAQGKINVNTASKGALESLYRVGPATADKIITNRPYQTIEELVSKKAVTQSVFEQIKNEITAF